MGITWALQCRGNLNLIQLSLKYHQIHCLPITLTVAVLADDSPRLFVAVQVYPPSSARFTELIMRDPL